MYIVIIIKVNLLHTPLLQKARSPSFNNGNNLVDIVPAEDSGE